MKISLTLADDQHKALSGHLFPDDGKEAAAILLCGQRAGTRQYRLIGKHLYPIRYDACKVRTEVEVTWPTEAMVPALEQAEREKLSVVKIHSHPGGYRGFSATDDEGDDRLMPCVEGWFDEDRLHGSAVMMPGGEILCRYRGEDGNFVYFDHVNLAGDDLLFWYPDESPGAVPEFATSHALAFGEGTFERIRRLSVAVVGCSGTGSPVIEQLARLGVGRLVLVDDDRMEKRNINRILGSTMQDVRDRRYKVDVLGDAVERMELGTEVTRIRKNLWHGDAVKAVAECDMAFGCMDTVDGRFLLNSIAAFYGLVYFDCGVRIVATQAGSRDAKIQAVCGSVHYIKPGGSSLISRGVFDMEDVRAAGLARTNPDAYAREAEEGYVRGIAVNRPAVISLNMQVASLAVNELLARLHIFRDEANSEHDQVEIDLCGMHMFSRDWRVPCPIFSGDVGKGDCTPLLELMDFSGGAGS